MATGDDAEAVGREYESLYVGRLRHVYRSSVRGFAIRLNRAAAQALANDPRVASVEEDGTVQIADTQLSPPWGLDRVDMRSLPLDSAYNYRTSQRTVHVHVIDTGIRTTHLEFGGRATIAGDFIDDDGDGDPNDIAGDDANPGIRTARIATATARTCRAPSAAAPTGSRRMSSSTATARWIAAAAGRSPASLPPSTR